MPYMYYDVIDGDFISTTVLVTAGICLTIIWHEILNSYHGTLDIRVD